MMKDGQHSEAGQNRSQRSVRFGAFEADLHTQELWKYGVRLKLAGQPFHVLEMLLARPGRAGFAGRIAEEAVARRAIH